jgi:hypothetical protein
MPGPALAAGAAAGIWLAEATSGLQVTNMNPSSPYEPDFPPTEPAPAPAQTGAAGIAPDKNSAPADKRAPVSPADASENTQGNEVHEEDIELSDATAARPPAGGAKP